MRAKVGEVYLDTKENKLFEIREATWTGYIRSELCTYFSDTKTILEAYNAWVDSCYLSMYCTKVELYSNLLIRNHIGVRVRLKEDDIKTVVRSPFSHPAEIGEIFYDEDRNVLFKLIDYDIGTNCVMTSGDCEYYADAVEEDGYQRLSIQYFNRYCVRAYIGSNFLEKDVRGIARVPKQPTKTDVYRAHVIEKSICVTPKRSRVRELTIKDIVENKTYKKLKEQIDKLNIGEVIKLSKLLHGRTYGIMGGRE